MGRVRMMTLVAAVTAICAACIGGEDVGDRTPPTDSTANLPDTTTTAATTSSADRTTLPDETSTSTASSGTVPPTTPVAVLHPVPNGTPPAQPIDEQPSASGLRSLGFCDPNSPSNPAVALTWVTAGAGGQLLAIATLPDGFESGRYMVTDELAADTISYQISPIEPGGIYYWRVLTRSGDRWLSSAEETFTGPTCVLDSP